VTVAAQGNRYYKSLKLTAKRLEEAALSYRGEERVQLLRRWLVGLKETERAASSAREPQRADDPDQPAPVLVWVSPTHIFLNGVFLLHFRLHCVTAYETAGSVRGLRERVRADELFPRLPLQPSARVRCSVHGGLDWVLRNSVTPVCCFCHAM
jgi:hypothetical protein